MDQSEPLELLYGTCVGTIAKEERKLFLPGVAETMGWEPQSAAAVLLAGEAPLLVGGAHTEEITAPKWRE